MTGTEEPGLARPAARPGGAAHPLAFLAGGGEMGALMRTNNWSATPLGPAADWPQALRTIVRLMLNTRHPMFIFWGPSLACLYNDAYRVSIGPERHPSAMGQPARQVWAEIWDIIGPQIDQVMSGGSATWSENQLVPITRGGRREDVYWTYGYSPIDLEGSLTGVGGVLVLCTETTTQVLAEQRQAGRAAARTAERDRLIELFTQAPSFIARLSGPEHRFEMVNAAYVRLVGHREVLGRTVADALPDAVQQGYLGLLDQVFRTGEAFTSTGARYVVQVVPGGPRQERFVDFIYQPVRDAAGAVTGILVVGADATDRTHAEAALRNLNDTLEQRVAAEVAARTWIEDALRHAQKMEAIGQMTGGIAHDFNNMLQGVVSGIELARRRIVAGHPENALALLDAALAAADRAAVLTRRLLAFSRRQTLDPRAVPPGDLLHGIAGLIQQTVGPAVTVEVQPRQGCWLVRCDPNGLENALLNLAINARDAMLPDGGRLLVGIADVVLGAADLVGCDGTHPGDYVRITVTDTGTGMTPDVLARACEPFFTTKPEGQGTGLGLSQIHGFMRQSGGVLRLESRIGAGTSAHLHLPRHLGEPAGQDPATAAPRQPMPAAASGTVLLVEDEPMIREFTARALRETGYQVLEARTAPEGLAVLQRSLQRPGVDLLVADVGLPGGLNGRQLAEAARELLPALPVLLVTGYAAKPIAGEAQSDHGMEVLGKPFDLQTLAERVQALIASALA